MQRKIIKEDNRWVRAPDSEWKDRVWQVVKMFKSGYITERVRHADKDNSKH